jgi:outer membrane protein TolC
MGQELRSYAQTLIAGFLSLGLAVQLLGAAEVLGSFTLDECVAYALTNSPGIHASKAEVSAAHFSARAALAPASPMLMTEISTAGAARVERIGVSQMLMFPGKNTLAWRAGTSMALAAAASAAQTEAAVTAQVRTAYAELYATGRTIEAMRGSLDLLLRSEESVRTAYSAGTAMRASLLRIQVQAASLEDEIRSMEVMGEGQKERFAALLGLVDAAVVPYPAQVPHMAPTETDPAGAARTGDSTNPSLSAMRHELQAARRMRQMAVMGPLPDLGLSAMYELPGDMGTSGSVMVGVSLSLPLWVGSSVAEARRAAFASDSKAARVEQMRLTMRAEVRAMTREYDDAVRRVDLLEGVLGPQARQALDLMVADYRTGRAGVVELLDGQQMLLDIEMKLAREVARRERIAAELDRMLGVRGTGSEVNP